MKKFTFSTFYIFVPYLYPLCYGLLLNIYLIELIELVKLIKVDPAAPQVFFRPQSVWFYYIKSA